MAAFFFSKCLIANLYSSLNSSTFSCFLARRRIAKAASSSAMKDKDKTLASSSTTTHVADPWASQKSRGGGSAPAVQVPVKLGLYGHGSYSFSATAVPVPSAGPVGVGGEQWPDLGEGLIVYHASTAPEAYHCRLLF